MSEPGIASAAMRMCGKQKLWITSFEDNSMMTGRLTGTCNSPSTTMSSLPAGSFGSMPSGFEFVTKPISRRQNCLNQHDRKFEVRGNSAANTCMIGFRVAAPAKADQHKNEKGRPSDKKRAHKPVREFEDMIDLVAVLGCVRRLAKKFVNEREATHRICPSLLR